MRARDLAVSRPDRSNLRRDCLPLGEQTGRRHGLEGEGVNCIQCGAEMKTDRENFLYEASGLPGVTLVGVEVSRCPNCGQYEVSIPHIEELHGLIAHTLIRKPARLSGAEVRFLRKWLGWSAADFAAHVGVTPETVSRWENAAASMGATADRLLRLMVVTKEPVRDYSLDLLKDVDGEAAQPLRLGMHADQSGWRAEAA